MSQLKHLPLRCSSAHSLLILLCWTYKLRASAIFSSSVQTCKPSPLMFFLKRWAQPDSMKAVSAHSPPWMLVLPHSLASWWNFQDLPRLEVLQQMSISSRATSQQKHKHLLGGPRQFTHSSVHALFSASKMWLIILFFPTPLTAFPKVSVLL